MKIIYLCILIFTMLNISCEKVYDWNKNTENIPLLIVEGMITNEKTAHLVRLSKPAENLNEINTGVTGAFVTISDGSRIYILSEDPLNPGNYYTSPDIRGVYGKLYLLHITVDGKEYTAQNYMVPVEPLDPFIYSACNNGYKAGFSDHGDPYMLELNMEWSGLPECPDSTPCHAEFFHYKLDNIDVNKLFKPSQEEVCFPKTTLIIRKKYSINPGHQEFLRSLLMETDWRGGIFDVERGNVMTNLSEGATGYFSACTVVSDTINMAER